MGERLDPNRTGFIQELWSLFETECAYVKRNIETDTFRVISNKSVCVRVWVGVSVGLCLHSSQLANAT